MRRRITEVCCDNCGTVIGHYESLVTECIRDDGAIVTWRGEYCDKKCLKEYEQKQKAKRCKKPIDTAQ